MLDIAVSVVTSLSHPFEADQASCNNWRVVVVLVEREATRGIEADKIKLSGNNRPSLFLQKHGSC